MKIACVVGARPNFMKIAQILEAMKKYPKLQPILAHTGQHYDYEMSGVFFMEHLIVIEPVGYLRFFNLMMNAKFVLTDSGGMQQETTVLGILCLTLRENTERPETVDEGANTLVGNNTQCIIEESFKILDRHGKTGTYPELWDGHAAEMIVKIINKGVCRMGW